MKHHLGRALAVCAVTAGALVGAPAAGAVVNSINGNPLQINLDSRGQLQVLQAGQGSFSFYSPSNPTGSAGFFLRLPEAAGSIPAGTVVGPQPIQAGEGSSDLPWQEPPTPPDAVTGSGTAADPFTQITTYGRVGVAAVKQTTTYVQGTRKFRQKFEVTNYSGSPLRFRGSVGADLYLEGADEGIGYFDGNSPRTVGGLSQATGRAGGLTEVPSSPWSAYQESEFSDIWGRIGEGTGFDNTINASQVDNGIGVQWDDHYGAGTGIANNATATYEVVWNLGLAGLTASPPSAQLPTGSFHQVTFTGTDNDGNLAGGQTLRYSISGANPSSGALPTAGNGQAQVGWVGRNPGTDTVIGFLDLNNNGVREINEPQTAANAVFVSPPQPGAPAFALSGEPIVQNGVTTLVVVVPSAGRLQVSQAPAGAAASSNATASAVDKKKKGKKKRKAKKKKPALIKSVTLNPKKAGPVKVKVRPSAAGKKILAKKGSFKVKVKVAFTPKGSKKTTSFTKTIKLKDKKKKASKKKKSANKKR